MTVANQPQERITVEYIERHAAESGRISDHIADMAREIYKMRKGQPIGSGYVGAGFRTFNLTKYYGPGYTHVEYDGSPDWGDPDLPIVSVNFDVGRAGDSLIVTFPQSYLGIDWKPIEQARINAELQAEAEQKAKEEDKKRIKREADELKNYHRLKAKFENNL